VAAGALDDPGGDGPSLREGLVVAEAAEPGGEVAGAGVGSGAPGPGEAGGVGLGGDVAGDAVAVAGEDGECLDGDPVLGGGIAGLVQAPGSLPGVLELSTVSARKSYVFAGGIVVAIDVTLARR
jgi:hypothetical protein